eukprot:11538294-Karenia_brevis.AAC.1
MGIAADGGEPAGVASDGGECDHRSYDFGTDGGDAIVQAHQEIAGDAGVQTMRDQRGDADGWRNRKITRPRLCKNCGSRKEKGQWGWFCDDCGAFTCCKGCLRAVGMPCPCANHGTDVGSQRRLDESLSVVPLQEWVQAQGQNSEESVEQLLGKIVLMPAPPQLHHVSSQLEL